MTKRRPKDKLELPMLENLVLGAKPIIPSYLSVNRNI
jgi:hypothetical protein